MSLFDGLPEETNRSFNPSEGDSHDGVGNLKRKHEDNEDIETDMTGSMKESVGDPITINTNVKKMKQAAVVSLRGSVRGRRGEREEMQDRHALFHDLSNDLPQTTQQHVCRLAYFGVFDGHAGSRASQYVADRLHKVIINNFPTGNSEKMDKEMKKCLVDSFRAVDEEFLTQASKQRPVWKDGTTATVLLVVNNTLYVANIGDSKAILCRESGVVTLTRDHCPTLHEERMRIQKTGATVKDGRVNGVLEVSRSIGDGHFKKYGVTCTPDIRKCLLTEKDRYLLIACDGLWKALNNKQTVEMIDAILHAPAVTACEGKSGMEVRGETVCARLSAEGVKRLSGDNVTVMFINLEHS